MGLRLIPGRSRDQRGVVFPSPVVILSVVAVAMAGIEKPDVVLMDLSMPVLDGIEATRLILDREPSTRVIALTSFADKDKVSDMLASGAVGYLLKDSEPAELLAAVRSASAGGAPLDPRVAVTLLPSRQPTSVVEQLSSREREVLALATQGLANKQIGRSLGIAERTVKVHLGNVFRRIGSDRRRRWLTTWLRIVLGCLPVSAAVASKAPV